MDTEEWVVFRYTGESTASTHRVYAVAKQKWDEHQRHARGKDAGAYELVAEGLTQEQAGQMCALTREES